MVALLLQKNRQIPRSFYAIIKAMFLLCSVIACVSHVLFQKKQLLASELTEVLGVKPFDMTLVLSIVLLAIFFTTLSYLFLFLEIAFMFNILIIILFQRIKVPNISI